MAASVFVFVGILAVGMSGAIGLAEESSTSTIDSCEVIEEPGHYELESDLSSEATCLQITTSDVTIDGNGHTIEGMGEGHGIQVVGYETTRNVEVRDLTVRNWEVGISYDGGHDGTIHTVGAGDNSEEGILVDDSDGVTIEDSVAAYNGANGIAIIGDDATVVGSTAANNSGHGLEINDRSRYPGDGYTIKDNSLTENDGNGLEYIGNDGLVVDNEAHDNEVGIASPVIGSNNTYERNTASGNQEGIAFGGETTDTTVLDNDVSENFIGINLDTSSTNVTVRENTATANDQGINIVSATDHHIEANTLLENEGHGIRMNNNANRNTVVDNTIRNTDDGTGYSSGVELLQFSNANHFESNTITGTGGHGIDLNQGSGNNVFVDTHIEDSEEKGVRLSDSDDVYFDGVTIHDSGDYALVAGEYDPSQYPADPLENVTATDFDIGDSTSADTTLDFQASEVALGTAEHPPQDPIDAEPAGRYVEIESDREGAFFDVEMHYEDDDVEQIEEDTLELKSYDDTAGWSSVEGSSVDTETQTVGANVTELSTVGVFGEEREVPSPELEVADFSGEFPDGEAGEDYGEVEVTVTETADVETENLEVELAVMYLATEQVVYQDSIDDRELQDESDTFTFDVGSFTFDGTYMASVTVSAEDTDSIWESTQFELEPPEDTPTGTIDLEEPIHEDQETFEITYSFDDTTDDDAVVLVGNVESGEPVNRSVEEDGTLEVDVEEIGGIQSSDEIRAEIWDEMPEMLDGATTEREPVEQPLDSDSTVVEGDAEVISDCTTIDSPGDYVLESDVSTDQTGDGNTCIEIRSSDVTLDGQGHAVVGGEPVEWRGSNYGIHVTHATNVEITDVHVYGWDELGTAIMVDGSTGVTLSNVVAENNTFGPRTDDVEEFTLRESHIEGNDRAGVQLLDASDATVQDTQVIENAQSGGWTGVYVRGESTGVTLDGVTAERNQDGGHGIQVGAESSEVTITDSVAAENDAAGFLIETSDVSMVDTHAYGNEWDVRTDAPEPLAVETLTLGGPGQSETTTSFEASVVELRGSEEPPANPDATSIGRYVERGETDGPVTLTIHYEPEDVTGVQEDTLSLWRYEDDEWSNVTDSVVDPEKRTVTYTSTEESSVPETFGVFGIEDTVEPGVIVEIDESVSELDVEEGERIVVVTELTNPGEAADTYEVTAELGGETRTDELAIEPGETELVRFEFEADPAFDGESVTVTSEDESDSATVSVSDPEPVQPPPPDPAFFEVSIDESASELDVEEDEEVTLVADVSNTGEEDATQELTVGFNETTVTESVTLDAEETTTVEYTFPVGAENDGDAVSLASEDDEETATVSVTPLEPENATEGPERSISDAELDAAETATVSVSVGFEESANFTIVESFDAFEDAEIVTDDGATYSGVSDSNDEVFATFDDREGATITFEVTLAEDASPGVYSFDGFVEADVERLTTTGEDAIESLVDEEDADVEFTRSIDEQTLAPGNSTTVTHTIQLDEPANVTVVDGMDAFESVEIVDDDGATYSGVSDSNDEVFATYTDREEVTLSFEATVEETPAVDVYSFDGIVEVEGSETSVSGDDYIVLADLPEGTQVLHTESTEIVLDEGNESSSVTFSENSTVQGIEFTTALTGQSIVTDFDGEPESDDGLDGSTVSTTQITVPENATDTNATIRKQVSADELEGIDVETLQIEHFEDGEWHTLETEVVEETDEVVVLEAETPGFSYFAVSGQEADTTLPWGALVIGFAILIGAGGAGYVVWTRRGRTGPS